MFGKGQDGDLGDIVGMGRGAFIVFHLKILEYDAEGQSVHLDVVTFLHQIGVGAFTFAEMEHTLTGGEVRKRSTGQNDHTGEMEHHGKNFPHAPFHKPGDACGCQQSPQHGEPP